VPYALPKSPAWVSNLERFVEAHDAVLLAGNGALTWGPDPETALLRMELVEHYARIMHAAQQLGPVRELPAADLEKLVASRVRS
jgi:L-fuculose-phosphate aldolase